MGIHVKLISFVVVVGGGVVVVVERQTERQTDGKVDRQTERTQLELESFILQGL